MKDRMKELEFRGPLGEGAHADVWRAWDPVLLREVAVKVFRVSCADTDQVLAHAQAMARVRHANVVAVHEIAQVTPPGATEPALAIVMELIDGSTLEKRLQQGKFARTEVRAFGLGLLEGLAGMHAVGVVHGDLHRKNLLLGSDGRARIIDVSLYRGTLSVVSTASRDELVARDVRGALSLLEDLIMYSDTDPAVSQRLRDLSRGSHDLTVLQGAFEEAFADFEPAPAPGRLLTAPTPDVRVATGAGATYGPPQPGLHFLMVTVANHSTVRLYVQSLILPLPGNQFLAPEVDAVYRRPISAPVIEPGDSWQVPLDAEEIARTVRGDLSLIQSVVITDKIGREYRANGDEVRAKLREVLARIEASRVTPSPSAAAPAEPDELQRDLLNMIAEDYLQTCQPLTGLRIRTRMREVGAAGVNQALDGCVPAWLQRNDQLPNERYTPTLSGMLQTGRREDTRRIVEAVLKFLHDAVVAEIPEIKLTPKALAALPGVGEIGVPFLAAMLDVARLTGGGGASGSPYTDFSYNAPYDLEAVIGCRSLEDLVGLRTRQAGR